MIKINMHEQKGIEAIRNGEFAVLLMAGDKAQG